MEPIAHPINGRNSTTPRRPAGRLTRPKQHASRICLCLSVCLNMHGFCLSLPLLFNPSRFFAVVFTGMAMTLIMVRMLGTFHRVGSLASSFATFTSAGSPAAPPPSLPPPPAPSPIPAAAPESPPAAGAAADKDGEDRSGDPSAAPASGGDMPLLSPLAPPDREKIPLP